MNSYRYGSKIVAKDYKAIRHGFETRNGSEACGQLIVE
jgi:hypothetical protein